MMNRASSRRFWAAMAGVRLLNILCYALALPYLPGLLPSHWDEQGAVDAFSSKYADFAFSFLPAAVLLVLGLAERSGLSQKASAKALSGDRSFVLVFMLWLSAITWMEELSYAGLLSESAAVRAFLFLGAGMLFLCLGHILPDLPQNRFAGVRTAASLREPDVWEKSQCAGGECLRQKACSRLCWHGLHFWRPDSRRQRALARGLFEYLPM